MTIEVVKIHSDRVEVRLTLDKGYESQGGLWQVPKYQLGGIGLLYAHRPKDTKDYCSLGSFRTRDGTQMQPDYLKLRKHITPFSDQKDCYYAN